MPSRNPSQSSGTTCYKRRQRNGEEQQDQNHRRHENLTWKTLTEPEQSTSKKKRIHYPFASHMEYIRSSRWPCHLQIQSANVLSRVINSTTFTCRAEPLLSNSTRRKKNASMHAYLPIQGQSTQNVKLNKTLFVTVEQQ